MALVASLPGAVVLVAAWLRAAAGASPALGRRGRSRRCLTARTRCSAAACRSTATSTAPAPRLLLSNDADFDRVDAVRASCDAILVGAATVRNDNPRLLVRSEARRDAAGRPRARADADQGDGDRRAELDARADFFTAGDAEKLVYCASPRRGRRPRAAGPVATVVDGGQPVTCAAERGPRRPRRASG